MREVVLRLPRIAVEDVLDRLLPMVPSGVREGRDGKHAELRMRGPDVPSGDAIAAAVGRWPHTIAERVVSDDWRERRRADYEPDVIADRLVVRREWAPAAPPGLLEIVLAETAAFGGGTHPTTRTCLELLLELEAGGSFADLGCGSGVLAVLAARLGWSPVTAFDINAESIAAARGNAERNGVEITAEVADLTAQLPPPSDGIAANVPPELQRVLAAGLPDPPRIALLSGFAPDDAADVLAAYARRGLAERRRVDRLDWSVLVLERG